MTPYYKPEIRESNMPFFTVIIPTYNRADLIVHSIESVINQTFNDFEIIVIDNKSTDDTVSRLQPYLKYDFFSLVVQERNYERARSRNKGFELARGKYVTLLDSDDILYPNCFADAVEYLNQNPDRKFFHCNYQIIDQTGRTLYKGSGKKPRNPFRELAMGNYISNIGLFMEQPVIKKIRVDETPVLIGMEDYDFILRVLYEVKSIGYIDKVNCGVLQHPGRTVMVQDLPIIEDRVRYFLKKNLSSELFEHDFRSFRNSFVSSNMLYLCGAAAVRGLTFKAIGYWFNSGAANVRDIFTIKYWRHFLVIIKNMFK
ncbi:MAG: glycosyltransferase [Chitinophagaceae bacterium]